MITALLFFVALAFVAALLEDVVYYWTAPRRCH